MDLASVEGDLLLLNVFLYYVCNRFIVVGMKYIHETCTQVGKDHMSENYIVLVVKVSVMHFRVGRWQRIKRFGSALVVVVAVVVLLRMLVHPDTTLVSFQH